MQCYKVAYFGKDDVILMLGGGGGGGGGVFRLITFSGVRTPTIFDINDVMRGEGGCYNETSNSLETPPKYNNRSMR